MKKTYILVILIISLITLALYTTYAMFTADLNIGEFVELTASTLPTEGYTQEYETIGIDAYQSKTINLNIKNSTSNSLYYGVWYEMKDPSTINSNIKIGLSSTSPNPALGQVASNETKLVTINVFNNTNNTIVINIGAGYSTTNSLNLPTNRTLVNGTFDTEAPSLSLDKVTYLDVPFDNKWTYDGATVTDGVLSYDDSTYKSYAISPFIPVNGEFWYMSFDVYSSGNGRIYWDGAYYGQDYTAATALNGYKVNGTAVTVETNKWVNNVYWKNDLVAWKDSNRYGPDVHNIQLTFKTTSTYKSAPLKLRNLKVYGQMKNSFYNINITSNDNVGVITTKCAKGIHSKEYFKENGIVVNNNQITVTENGTYTVYVEDAIGNSTIDTIEITNINVPIEYQKVEYIKNSGTQYIDTEYYWQHENIEVNFDGRVITNSSSQSLFGNEEYTSSGNTRNFAGIPYGTNGNYSIYLGEGSNGTISTTVGTRFKLDIRTTTSKNLQVLKDNNEVMNKTYNGSVMTHDTAYTNSTTSTTVGNIFIFANHNTSRGANDNAIQIISAMELYAFKLYDNNILVRDFVPCYRKSDGVVGLYDTANGVFYTNKGTGTFTKGENIPAISS